MARLLYPQSVQGDMASLYPILAINSSDIDFIQRLRIISFGPEESVTVSPA